MLRIFFSYRTGDRKIAELYEVQIEQMNMCVYLFEQGQQPRQSVVEKVKSEPVDW
jgi:hypothetical protein